MFAIYEYEILVSFSENHLIDLSDDLIASFSLLCKLGTAVS